MKIALYATVPFQLRILSPIAAGFEDSLISFNPEEVMSWGPDFIIVSAEHELPLFRQYCDSTGCLLIGLRHGAGFKYVSPPKEYKLADYICGSEWDQKDFQRAGIIPRIEFLYTGNSWVDEVFRIPQKETNKDAPTVLFAPTWNPDTSAAGFFEGKLVKTIREVYPSSKIIIRPHPNILTYDHKYLQKYADVYKRWIADWKLSLSYGNVTFVEDPGLSLPSLFTESDVMISDASTGIFEFMILNKPVLLYTSPEKPDVADYDPDALGNKLRQVGAEFSDIASFQNILSDCFSNHVKKYSTQQKKYTDEIFGRYQDGKSYLRIINAIKRIKGEHSVNHDAGLKITKKMGDGEKLMSIGSESDFAVAIKELFRKIKPSRIIETGTYLGQGTTRIIAEAIKELNLSNAEFHSIEVNPAFYLQAFEFLLKHNLLNNVVLHNGLSVPRTLLPDMDEIQNATVDNIEFKDIFIDHDASERAKKYYDETNFKNVDEDLLGKCLRHFNYSPDFVLLDSAGHMGNIEFNYLLSKIRSECYIGLDDVHHLKHHKTLKQIQSDQRFEVIKISEEKFGFCLAKFTPGRELSHPVPELRQNQNSELPDNIIAIGLIEHMGDIIACEPVVRYIRSIYADSYIVWVTSEKYKEIPDSNPFVDETYTVGCLTEWILLKESNFFTKVIDLHIQERVCPTCNFPLDKDKGRQDITLDNYYNYGNLLSAFTQAAGLPILNDAPRVYLSGKVVSEVDELNLPKEYVVFHCLSNEPSRDWEDDKWISLAYQIKEKYGLEIVEVGHKSVLRNDKKLNFKNLCGSTTILQTAEVIRRARIFIGVDSSAAHIANAVGTYGLILLGSYRAFEKYVPYSGDYGNGFNSELLYAAQGPASGIPVIQVLFAFSKAMQAPSHDKSKSLTTAADKKHFIEDYIKNRDIRLFSIYLPQFHPISENNRWWGKGFTEWTNVTKAKPLFPGHYQPHLPSDLGFYDLRLPESRKEQAELADQYGIEGFCYYHYWFNGKRLLEKPFNAVLESGEPDFPFSLIWANENWTRRWDGRDSEMLQEQTYGGLEDVVNHFLYLLKAFSDKRYLRIRNKPVFMIYRPSAVEGLRELITVWRFLAERAGLDGIYLIAIRTGFETVTKGYWLNRGFDNELVFQPGTGKINKLNERISLSSLGGGDHVTTEAILVDYEKAWNIMKEESQVEDNNFSCVVPGWDSSPRRAKIGAYILHNSSPDSYEKWLKYEISRVLHRDHDERLVILNAWNEWAEGNHLEPDQKFGCGYLEATRTATDTSLVSLAKLQMLKGNFLYASSLLYKACLKEIKRFAAEYHKTAATLPLLQFEEDKKHLSSTLLSEIYFLFALVHLDKDESRSKSYLHLSIRNDENNVLAALLLAEIYFNSGNQVITREIYRELFSADNSGNIIEIFAEALYYFNFKDDAVFFNSANLFRGSKSNSISIPEYNLELLNRVSNVITGKSLKAAKEIYKSLLVFRDAKVYYENGDYHSADKTFENLAGNFPENQEFLEYQALTKMNLNQSSEALELIKKAVRINNKNIRTLKAFANILLLNGNSKEAIQLYKMLIHKYPGNTKLLFEIAKIQLNYGNSKEAESILTKILEIDPLNYESRELKLSLTNDSDTEK